MLSIYELQQRPGTDKDNSPIIYRSIIAMVKFRYYKNKIRRCVHKSVLYHPKESYVRDLNILVFLIFRLQLGNVEWDLKHLIVFVLGVFITVTA